MNIRSVNPADGRLIKELQSSTHEDVIAAVLKAKNAFEKVWSKVSYQEKSELFKALASLISDKSELLLNLISIEMGKPKGTGQFEIDDILVGIRHYLSEYSRLINIIEFPISQDDYPQTNVKLPLLPHGVIGIISPWNFPFWTPMTNIVPAIMAGNTVVFKPDEHTSLMGIMVKDLFDQAGFPDGVLNVVIGAEDVGKALVESDIDKIVITGSVKAGSDVIRRAGLKPSLLELGGNDAAIVCDDANLAQAVGAVCWGAIYNAGQACAGIKRVFVHSNVADEFISQSVKYVKGLQRYTDYGPIIDEQSRSVIANRVIEAVRCGSELLVGGTVDQGEGFWLDPIVLVYKDDSLELVREETFGPVLPIRIVGSNEEAIRLANNTGFGLGANIWTQDIDKGYQLAMKLEAKMICVNEALFGLPGGEYWGGWKNSGLATTESRLLSYLRRKLVTTYAGKTPRSWWYPANFEN